MTSNIKIHFLPTGSVLLALFDLFLLNFPLTNLLGYEYSLFNGLFVTVLTGLFTISLLRKNERNPLIDKEFRNRLVSGFLIFFLMPLLIGIIAAFFIKNCSLAEGILFYLVFTGPSVLIGSALGFLSRFFSRRFPRLVFAFLCLIVAMVPLCEIYFNPQIFFYNPLAAFYPGTIYDESIAIDLKLITYRSLNIIFFGAILFFLYYYLIIKDRRLRALRTWFTAGVIIIPAVFIFLSDYFGFSSSEERIKRELGGFYRTKHFDIVYDRSIDKNRLTSIILHHEYYFDEISSYFNLRSQKRITTFLFRDQNQKKELMGSENADVAKPWLSQLYIRYDNYRETLQHEIAHCLSAPFGTTIFKVASGINPAMIEGIAMAAENDYDGMPVHFMAGLAYNNNYRVPVTRLFKGLNFFGQYSALSYIYAGSFIRYIIDRFGIEKFKRIYAGNEFTEIYGKSLEVLADEYYLFIKDEAKDAGKDMAMLYYGRLPIFKKVCARFLAGQIKKGWALYEEGMFRQSENHFLKLLDYSASYSSLSGYISSLVKQKRFNAAIRALENNLGRYDSTSYIYTLKFQLADLKASAGDYSRAEALYREIISKKPSVPFVIASQMRLGIIKDSSSARVFFRGNDFEKFSLLSKLNKDSIFYPSIPALISLAEENKVEYGDLMSSLDGRIKVTDPAGCYAAWRLSQYASGRLDIERAKKYAVHALKCNKEAGLRDMLKANLKKINWFSYYPETL